MKIYFVKNNAYNMVVATDEKIAKIFNGASNDGMFEGIDLYSENVIEELEKYFRDAENIGDFRDWNGDSEAEYDDIEKELNDATLLYGDN